MNWVGSVNLSDSEELVGGQSQVCLITVDLTQLLLWMDYSGPHNETM